MINRSRKLHYITITYAYIGYSNMIESNKLEQINIYNEYI